MLAQTYRREVGSGDSIETDQRTHESEGYGGRVTDVIIIDWEGCAASMGPSVGAVARTEVSALRALPSSRCTTPCRPGARRHRGRSRGG